jgi:hypothetical protein
MAVPAKGAVLWCRYSLDWKFCRVFVQKLDSSAGLSKMAMRAGI